MIRLLTWAFLLSVNTRGIPASLYKDADNCKFLLTASLFIAFLWLMRYNVICENIFFCGEKPVGFGTVYRKIR